MHVTLHGSCLIIGVQSVNHVYITYTNSTYTTHIYIYEPRYMYICTSGITQFYTHIHTINSCTYIEYIHIHTSDTYI